MLSTQPLKNGSFGCGLGLIDSLLVQLGKDTKHRLSDLAMITIKDAQTLMVNAHDTEVALLGDTGLDCWM